jgi:hypothetical protein
MIRIVITTALLNFVIATVQAEEILRCSEEKSSGMVWEGPLTGWRTADLVKNVFTVKVVSEVTRHIEGSNDTGPIEFKCEAATSLSLPPAAPVRMVPGSPPLPAKKKVTGPTPLPAKQIPNYLPLPQPPTPQGLAPNPLYDIFSVSEYVVCSSFLSTFAFHDDKQFTYTNSFGHNLGGENVMFTSFGTCTSKLQ